jgi:hypothetical protein
MPKTTLPPKCQAPGCEKEHCRRSRFCSVECYFWSRFDRSAGPDACWLWTGSVNPVNGYGVVDDHAGGGKRTSAHRHAYRLTHGDPGGLSVLHRCDTRLCGNPRHLFLGTHLDNWIDSVNKGRQPIVLPGERNGSAKLTAAEVRAIRRSAAPMAELVRQYRVNDSTIRRVIKGINWRHVPQEDDVLEMAGAE